ncbi:MAG: hypothetical protein JNG84_03270 [Archangium sp.]|nr:hypothetical protein [Archangium sp.]
MTFHSSMWRAVCGAAVVLLGCPKDDAECITGDEPVCEEGQLPEDRCNSPEEAQSDPRCAVTVGSGCPAGGQAAVALEGYISTLADGSADKDWYLAQLPDGLNPRCLLHVTAAYAAPQTAVNLLLNVLRDDGARSVASGIDNHGAAAPKPIDLIVPFSESNAKLLIQLSDKDDNALMRKVDNRNPYQLLVEVLENPDPNEPNDATPTAIALTASGSGQTALLEGTSSGYLATNDDVDRFTFDVASGARQIIYVHISSPAMTQPLLPALAYRLSYVLNDPAGVPISEGVMENEFLQIDLATARLAATPGTYTLVVQGYKLPNQSTPAKGDLRVKYDVDVRVLPDLDTQEPNDSPATAPTLNLTPGTTTLTGRISYVADEEWFKLVVPPGGSARTLRYAFAPGTGGRFPPLSAIPSRQLRLITQITTGATLGDRVTNCTDRADVCPRSFTDKQSPAGQSVVSLCTTSDPPQCLWSERIEEATIPGLRQLKNFVGAVPVPAAGGTFLFLVRDEGKGQKKYADDAPWSVELSLDADADEQARLGGPTQVQLGPSSIDAPGVLSFGHGQLLELDANDGNGVRGPNDYDAYETDKDMYEFAYPINAQGDQSWGLEWVLGHNDGGTPPADLALEVAVCGSALPLPDGGLCQSARQVILAATFDAITPWYLPVTNGNQRILFTKSVQANSTVITATPAACYCVGATRVQAGRFYVNVAAINRTRNDPLSYRLRQTIAPYPAGNTMCPVSDGGCRFTPQ